MNAFVKKTAATALVLASCATGLMSNAYADKDVDYQIGGSVAVEANPEVKDASAIFTHRNIDYKIQGSSDIDIDADESAQIAKDLKEKQPFRAKGIQGKLWFVTAELLGAQMATLAVLSTLPSSSTGWGKGSLQNIIDHAVQGPHFDTDPLYWNFMAHPFVGSEYYLLARNRNANWWQSLIYSAAMSAFWEYVTEGFFERPSVQDLVITPVAGAVLGELRYQAKEALIDPKTGKADRTWKKVLIVILDPINALSNL